jgi:hypothetical protein
VESAGFQSVGTLSRLGHGRRVVLLRKILDRLQARDGRGKNAC